MNFKSFLIGFFLSALINITLIIVLGVNFFHSAIISKISTETGFVNVASSESGVEKLASLVAINLANDYCSASSLGSYFFVHTSESDSETLRLVKDYLKNNQLPVECKA